MSTRPPDASAAKRKRKGPKPGPAVKPFFRIHAHTNPLADKDLEYPVNPQSMDWRRVFPKYDPSAVPQQKVEIVDVGCAWGGLAIALAEQFPDRLVLGLEIRERVAEYTQNRIAKLREDDASGSGKYNNVGALVCNAMKNLPNYFPAGTVTKLFFTFPDPHFKRCKQRRRIINPALLAEYAYVMADGGILYTITDVEDLHVWMASCLDAHPLFVRLTQEEMAADPCVNLISTATEESKKVDRAKGKKWPAVYRRVPRTPIPLNP